MVNESVVIVVIIQTFALLSVVFVFAWRYKKTPPDMAMVVYGRSMPPNYRGSFPAYRVISGGGKFLLPIVESTEHLDLGVKALVQDLDNVPTDPTKGGPMVRVSTIALYRVPRDKEALVLAVERVMGKTQEDIKSLVGTVLEGVLRGIASMSTSRDLDVRREEFTTKVLSYSTALLRNYGIELSAYAIIDVQEKGVSSIG